MNAAVPEGNPAWHQFWVMVKALAHEATLREKQETSVQNETEKTAEPAAA